MSTVALVATFVMAGAGAAIADESSSGSSGSGSLGSSGAAEVDPLTFDGWGTCPIEDLEVTTCASVVVRGGTMKLGALSVPIPDGSLKVAGGVKYATQPDNSFIETFVAKQDGSNGVYSNPISVPGGALGIDTPLGLTQISATVESVGVPDLKVLEQELTMPVRLKLSNPLLGDDCYIGSVSNPINLHLTTTGNPPSEPIGEFPGAVFPAVPHSDAVFAAPGASGCGPLGALNWAVNLRGGLPAASGKNSLTTSSDVYAVAARKVRPPA
ncbi:hypothetical protein QNA23_03580 [Rhodococcus erythropolis]|nr:hypothetical protein [Rhodococcus erythropolis]MDJ0402539.1 hypothetical protein [Rhodococcus erythropolis]